MPKLAEQSLADSDLLRSIQGVRSSTQRSAYQNAPLLHTATNQPPVEDLHLSEEWNLACRVAASRRLAKSALLPRFLLYICEQSLMGNSHLLTEQRIGTSIFNRPHGYNPGEDNIVRSYARTLRRRLEEYFAAEGRDEAMRIVVPRGGYIPVFESQHVDSVPSSEQPRDVAEHSALALLEEAPALDAVPEAISTQVLGPKSEPKPHAAWWMLLAGAFVGIVITSALWITFSLKRPVHTQSVAHPLWTELFQQNRDTVIVPADSGLGILQNLTGRLDSLEDYADGAYASDVLVVPGLDPASLADLRQQRYTSLADLNIATRLMQLPEFTSGRTQVRFPRSITAEDLKSSNAILLGSSHTNPWVSLFQDKVNFRLQYTSQVNRSFVRNMQPRDNEQEQYLNGAAQNDNRTYGVVDYLPNLEGSGHVLIIQGLNMAATQAAADILFNAGAMQPVLKRATRANGSLCPFEVLIQTSSIGATNPGAKIIATRFYE